VSTIPGTPADLRNLLDFEVAPGNTEIAWNVVDVPGKFYS